MQLNQQQLKAIESIEGPLLIVAGAGTGKTRVITQRIAYLINNRNLGVDPSNILALTFSKKAAGEMLERVEDLVGEHKDEIWISTFHAFCYRILRDHALEAGLSSRFRLLGRVEQWIFFRNILPQLGLKYYLNASDPASCIDAFLRFIGKAKNELVSPEEYEDYAKQIEEKEERQRQKEIARVYKKYQEFLTKHLYLDFGDMVINTIKLFSKRGDILKRYQDRFGYILVDEFQDTNIAQIELISMLACKQKNICAVGDDDQGIYRFRGASYASFVKFKERFPNVRTLRLEQNYRSTKKILSVAERLIKNNNPDRYDPKKNLFTQNEEGDAVEALYAINYRQEAKAVLAKIKDIYSNLPDKDKDYSKFAILYRAHNHKEEILTLLKQEEIPFTVAGGMGLFDQEEIKDILAWFKLIDDAGNSVSLFRILSSEKHNLDLNELVALSRQAKQERTSLFLKLDKRSEKFKSLLNELTICAQKEDVSKLAYTLLDKTRYLEDFLVKSDAESENKILNIGRFYRFINNFNQNYKENNLSAFLKYLDYYQQAGGDVIEEEVSLAKGVQLMTVHQAKGLEFPYVFVISMTQGRFPTRRRPESIPFPADLIKESIPAGDFHLQEERRLCYVAFTRACKKLFISCLRKRYHKPSVFIGEVATCDKNLSDILENNNFTQEAEQDIKVALTTADNEKLKLKRSILQTLTETENIEASNKQELKKRFKTIEGVFNQYVRSFSKRKLSDKPIEGFATSVPIPENLRLSYSQIDTYLSCPLKYKYSYVYSIPTRPTGPLSFGTDMHYVLKEFYMRIRNKEKLELGDLKKIYTRHWSGLGYEDSMQLEQYKLKGTKLLENFYTTNKDNLKPPLYIEEEFLIKIKDHGVKGYIDRIDELPDGSVEVIDYKTGKQRTQTAAKNIQLNIYAIACQEVMKLEPSVLSLYYLETNQKHQTLKA